LAPGMAGVSAADTPGSPFPSSWDLPLAPLAPVVSDSSALVDNLVTQYENAYGAVTVNGGSWMGYPVFTVPADEPDVPISVSAGCNNFTPDTGTMVPIPATATPGPGTDSPVIIYQPSTDTEWEFWQANNNNGSWSACWGGKLTDLATSDGVFPNPYGLSASGISYLATLITEADVASGSIDHTIALQVTQCNGSVAPADRTDCGSDPGQVSEGSFLRFPPTLAMPAGLTPFAQMVFSAIKNYGMVVTDQSGSVDIEAETAADWSAAGNTGTDPITASWAGQPEYSALDGMPWGDLQVIDWVPLPTISP
jgi:hypothetical protein